MQEEAQLYQLCEMVVLRIELTILRVEYQCTSRAVLNPYFS
jgi:hypothetical protein